MNSALLSSKKMDWCTPQKFFDELNREFSFVADVAATEKNKKAPICYTPETDGLSNTWVLGGGGILQPTLRKRDRKMGKESIRGGAERRYGSNAYTRKNRHELFSRLHIRKSGGAICER